VAPDEFAVDLSSVDPEIRMRADRLGWALLAYVRGQVGVWQDVERWLNERWKTGLACSGAYSISERLSNLILLWNLRAPDAALHGELKLLMGQDADHLLAHLEYHGDAGTNNHILNNARALILAGSFLGITRFYEAGCWLLDGQLTRHVDSEGVIRECSSHYQWVITRWLVEVGCVFHSMDVERFQRLRAQLFNMLKVCDALCLGEDDAGYLPLIGDISPDFPPQLYRGMTGLGYALLGEGKEAQGTKAHVEGFWSMFFVNRRVPSLPVWQSPDGGCVRIRKGKWSLIAHSDVHVTDNRSTHGHHDLFSFELAYDGIPVIVDPGRGSYLAGRDLAEAGILEEWHNTILVNNKRTGFVPRGYMPASWLTGFRTRPSTSASGRQLKIRLDAPREVPGISCIRRVVDLQDGHRVIVTNLVTSGKKPCTNIKLVLYVAGQVSKTDSAIMVETGAHKFRLCWSGIDAPLIERATRYIAYATPEPCTRLEWTATATEQNWESKFEILVEDGTK